MNEEWENEEEYEEEDDEIIGVGDIKKRLLKAMSQLDPIKNKEDYAALSQRLDEITEAERNEMQTAITEKSLKYQWLQGVWPALGGVVGNAIGQILNRGTVKDVIRYEQDGNILNTKATGFIKKP